MIEIRKVKLNDAPDIAKLHAESWRDNYHQVLSANYLKSDVFTERAQVWDARLSTPQPNRLILVAEIDGKFAGFLCAYGAHHPELGTIIDNLHVKPETKGLGIGSLLLATAFRWARIHYGESAVYLEVLACNPKAIRFYESRGAQKSGEGIWHTPCGNKAKEYIYSWGSPPEKINKPSNSIL